MTTRQTSLKWGFQKNFCGYAGYPMWLAEMELPPSNKIQNAISKWASSNHYCYSWLTREYYKSVANWHGVASESIAYFPSASIAINTVLSATTNIGDSITLVAPAYKNLVNIIVGLGRIPRIVSKDTIIGHLNSCNAGSSCLLVNPHNPTGTILTEMEFSEIQEICYKKRINLIMDEVFADLSSKRLFRGYQGRDDVVTVTTPRKAFCISGIPVANVICLNKAKLKAIVETRDRSQLDLPSGLVEPVTIAAYQGSQQWLLETNKKLQQNREYLISCFDDLFTLGLPEAGFVALLDFSKFFNSSHQVREYLSDSGIGVNDSSDFVKCDSRMVRLNYGCDNGLLRKLLEPIAKDFGGKSQ